MGWPVRVWHGIIFGVTRRRSGDGFLRCSDGAVRWGIFGASGVLFVLRVAGGEPLVMVQKRSAWAHEGGTWSIAGGALDEGEWPLEGALREAGEEIGVVPQHRLLGDYVFQPAADWSYTTGIAEASAGQRAIATDHESDAMEWVPWKNLEERLLMPAFKESMPLLEALLGRTLLVVDSDRLPADWERPVADLAASGIPSTILPTEVQDPILAGMAAARDENFERTVALFPDILIEGAEPTIQPTSPTGAIPAALLGSGLGAADAAGYRAVFTLGLDITGGHPMDPLAFEALLEETRRTLR